LKLTNPESIQESEKEFIDTIIAELDWDAIEQMLLDKHGFSVQDDVDYKEGNLIVHNNEIAYKFDFEIKVPLSVIFNRDGDCLEMSTESAAPSEDEDLQDLPLDQDSFEEMDHMSEEPPNEQALSETPSEEPPESEKSGKGVEMASEIADMISEINSEIKAEGE